MKNIIFILMLAVSVQSCNDCTYQEQIRLTSPDGRLDAILMGESCGGAAGTYLDKVYIVQKGMSADHKSRELVFEALDLKGEKLQWVKSDLLEIQYKKARIVQFRNYIVISGDNRYYVEIRETPLSPPPSFEHYKL